jgi:hypothetical protein
LVPYEKGEKLDWMAVAANKVMELACEGNAWAIDHVATRFDGKPRDQVELTTNTSVKIRYESYEEVRAALLEEGINVDQLPMQLTCDRPRDRSGVEVLSGVDARLKGQEGRIYRKEKMLVGGGDAVAHERYRA